MEYSQAVTDEDEADVDEEDEEALEDGDDEEEEPVSKYD